jgi:hypothetical protein
MTLELLKNVGNLTSSRSLVLLNCPMYVDQIEYLQKEFCIDRVFYISGNEKAVAGWSEAYCQQGGDQDRNTLAKVFNESNDRLELITTHFSRLGKLERFDVIDTPKPKMLQHMVEQATMPQFAIVSGVTKFATTQAAMLATAYGVGVPVTTALLQEYAQESLKRRLDTNDPAQMFSALQQFAGDRGYPLLVLNNYPATDKDAAAFQKYFGDPKVVVSLNVEEEALVDTFKEENPEDESDPEELTTRLTEQKKQNDKVMDEFKSKSASSFMSFNLAEIKETNIAPQTLSAQIQKRCLPQVYVLVAPSGQSNFSGLIANTICRSRTEGKRPSKITIIDSDQLFRPGGHSNAIEDKLSKAAFTAASPDAVSAPLWKELFAEAVQTSVNPMGIFLVTNFPTPCCLKSSPTIRDQFSMLESISTFMGIFHVKVTESVFFDCTGCNQSADYSTYSEFEGQVKNTTLVQFGAERIKESVVDNVNSREEAAKAIAADFLSFQEKAETGK